MEHTMERDSDLKRILAWTGVLALLSVPLVMLFRRSREADVHQPYTEDGHVFESELEG